MSGMGEASVGFPNDDPLAPTVNPAQLGLQSQSSFFSYGNNSEPWLPQFHVVDLRYESVAFNAGINLKTIFPEKELPISIGIGYSKVKLNLGTFVRTTEQGPAPIETFDAWEKSDQYMAAVGADYWVRASLGISYKHVVSHLGYIGMDSGSTYHDGIANLLDYGFLLQVPIVDILSRIRGEQIQLLPGLAPSFDWSIGISRNNSGQETISYIDPAQGDPLPRLARVGMSVNGGVTYRGDAAEIKVVSFAWTLETEDLLVKYAGSSMPRYRYQSGLGDIDIFDEVLLGHGNRNTEKKKGWEVGMYEFYYVRGGSFEEDPMNGNRNFETRGWSVSSVGATKIFRALFGEQTGGTILNFVLNNIDIRYSESTIDVTEVSSPLYGMKFRSLSLFVRN